MKAAFYLTAVVALTALLVSGEQQRILRRVIKSTPTASNLARVRLVTIRSATAEKGAVTEISSKEAASFGARSSNETLTSQQQQQVGGTKAKAASSTSSPAQVSSTTTLAPQTTSTTPPTTTSKPESKNRASERQQVAPQQTEVELLASAPSSWQTMSAVEAPAAMLIATGTRAAINSDLTSASSTYHSSEESASSTGDFLRSSSTKGGANYAQPLQQKQSVAETFSRLRQQQSQQSYFRPQQSKTSGKTSNYQASKTNWYQLPTTTTTQRPAPIIQEKYEQQNEQYVEQQQQQVEYGSAPLGQAEPFAFDFKTEDNSGNGQYRREESDKNGVVRGSYGYTDANGIYRHVEYVADENGFRANIKSNEPGLIGETQPASIQLASGAAPAQPTSRLSAPSSDNGDWISSSSSNEQRHAADLAVAPPDFESSHKSERIRSPRHFHI